jgi:hypothetical protein
MAKEDVTRLAVKAATLKIAAATDKLKLILFTGPDQVLMTPGEVQKAVEGGNTKLLPYTEAANSTDNSLLDSMLANAQVRRQK